MGNEDQERNLETIQYKIDRIENLIELFTERDFSDNELIIKGRKGNHLIYNYEDEKFEFVEIAEGKHIENSLPSYSLTSGNRGCLKFWRDHIKNLALSLENLKRNLK